MLTSRLVATPEQVWARVRHSGFIGDYLGARLPPAELLPGGQLAGTGRDGLPMIITVVEALAPCSLWLQLSVSNAHTGGYPRHAARTAGRAPRRRGRRV